MGTNTYANSNEICSKSSSGKTVAAMPDPCFTPPPTPAGVEVVVPYPNTAMASDLDKGSAKVLICNKMAALEKDSYIKTSTGNEAAKPSTMQGGVVTKTTKGKAFFTVWSPDVKFEGKGVCRHIDPTTHNHGSTPGHCVPMPFMSGMDPNGACSNEIKKIEDECKTSATQGEGEDKKIADSFIVQGNICAGMEHLPRSKNFENIDTSGVFNSDGTVNAGMKKYVYVAKSGNIAKSSVCAAAMAETVESNPCLRAMRCALHKYEDTDNAKQADDKPLSCCKGQSGHHVVPSAMGDIHCLGTREKAPVVCVEGVNNCHGTHGMIHRNLARILKGKPELYCYEILDEAANSLNNTFSDCDSGCVFAQLHQGEKTCKCGHADAQSKKKTHPGLNAEVVGEVEKAY